jgi:hypothetical protein
MEGGSVPELRGRAIAVIVCAADAEALDALITPGHGSTTLRTCPDEALVVAARDVADTVAREVRDRIAALDHDALVLDMSDGWSAWSLIGPDAADAFSYLSALPAPGPGDFVQGDVARIGATVLGEDGALTILVPGYWSEHVRVRALRDARAIEVPA